MFRKIMCTFWALAMVGLLGIPAQAVQTGSIRIHPQCARRAVDGGTVALYRVGEPEEGGYRVTDGLADWTIWKSDVYSEEVRQWILKQERTAGYVDHVREESGACFSGLAPGLYLAVQETPAEGYFPFSPFLVEIPEGDSWEIVKRPSLVRDVPIPETGDRPAPIIGAMGLGFVITVLMLMMDKGKK